MKSAQLKNWGIKAQWTASTFLRGFIFEVDVFLRRHSERKNAGRMTTSQPISLILSLSFSHFFPFLVVLSSVLSDSSSNLSWVQMLRKQREERRSNSCWERVKKKRGEDQDWRICLMEYWTGIEHGTVTQVSAKREGRRKITLICWEIIGINNLYFGGLYIYIYKRKFFL